MQVADNISHFKHDGPNPTEAKVHTEQTTEV